MVIRASPLFKRTDGSSYAILVIRNTVTPKPNDPVVITDLVLRHFNRSIKQFHDSEMTSKQIIAHDAVYIGLPTFSVTLPFSLLASCIFLNIDSGPI